MQNSLRNSRSGFTLVELLTVIAVIGILAGLSVPALRSVVGGNEINTAARQVSDLMAIARSTAISQNTETRFVVATDWTGNTNADYRSVSIWKLDSNGTTIESDGTIWTQVTKWESIPSSVMFDQSSTTSTYTTTTGSTVYLFDSNTATNTFTATAHGQPVIGRYVEFYPTGAAQVPCNPSLPVSQPWMVLASSPGGTIKAGNTSWATISANPFTGRIKITRP